MRMFMNLAEPSFKSLKRRAWLEGKIFNSCSRASGRVGLNVSVQHVSRSLQPFHEVNLVVKGCPDVDSSLDLFTDSEDLCGDNIYDAGEHGLQDAQRCIKFRSYPPVLQLHLGRINRSEGPAVKINDRYKFPLELNLDYWKDCEADPGNIYTLHSVLVHTGGVNRGHFYVYIRPRLLDKWFEFNDESVTEADSRIALEGQYGGEEATRANQGNAYMLIYIRESEKDNIFCNFGVEDLPRHLLARLKEEQKPAPSDVPKRVAPVWSCTGKQVPCKKDGGRWESRCCTQNLSVYPLPQSTRGRTMRYSKYEKMLEDLVAQGHDVSCPIDLKSYWAKPTR